MSAARKIAEFACSLELEAVPEEVVEMAKLNILDLLGCGLAADGLGLAGAGRAAAAELGEGDASVIGLAGRLPAANAALANGMLCHALDYDDTHSDAVCHISTVVVPAAMAVAEASRLTGADLLAAVVAGTETVARIGMAVSGGFHRRGVHPTSACGVLGAAIAAARLQRLDVQTTTQALGIAGSMSSGLLAFLNDGVQTKPIHAGWAAHGGVLATRIAAHGGEGPASVIEGRFGLLETFADGPADVRSQVSDLGERWETLRVARKPYPACHYMHGSLGATESLLGRVSVPEIAEIVVTVPENAVASVCEPEAEKLAIRSDYEGKFSLQYSTAALLLWGRIDLDTFSATRRADPAVQELTRRVRYEVAPYATDIVAFPGGVRIVTVDGRVLKADFPHQLGSPENPMGEQRVREKFRANASLSLDAATAEALEVGICSLELQDDLESLFSLLGARQVAI